jgi:UMF1 family MFS transporter
MQEKNVPKVIRSWTFYDWANSVYNLVITSTIFPIYYETIAVHRTVVDTAGKATKYVTFLGREFVNTELYSYVFSASFIVVACLVPILSGIADYTGSKKSFMQFFCYLGAAACISLFWFDPNHLEISMISPFLASIGFWGSLVFYNSYLPEIATPDQHDKVSARGFALGYIGSVILLVAILVANKMYEMPVKYGFLVVGIWWAGFAQYTYKNLPNNSANASRVIGESYFLKGFSELRKVFKELISQVRLKRFLIAYFVYNMGVQTIMLLAPIFAASEILWPEGIDGQKDMSGLIVSIIIIQLVAVIGATTMSRLSRKIGNLKVIRIVIVIWMTVCATAYVITTPNQFYILAAMVGFVMGGIQSMSRSTYSKMLPETEDTTSYFSFFDVLEKIGLIFGPLFFGILTGLSGGMRNSVLMLMIFFIAGFILMFRVKATGELLGEVDVQAEGKA